MRSRDPSYNAGHRATFRSPTELDRAVSARNGAVTVWLLIAAPVLLVLVVLVSDLANIWVARMELEHALESAALAAVEHWGKGGTRGDARDAGVAFALANNVRGVPVAISDNETVTSLANPNGNDSCYGNLILGEITVASFDPGGDPTAGSNDFGVKAQATRNVLSLWKPIFGLSQPYKVSAVSYAYFNADTTGPARLVIINAFTCP